MALEAGCKRALPRCEDLPPGTYELTGEFALLRGLRVTVPGGWSSAEQDAGEFELHQPLDSRNKSDINFEIKFWRDLVPVKNGRAEQSSAPPSADELVSFLLADPPLEVAEGPKRSFALASGAAVEARSLRVTIADNAANELPDCPAEACVGFLTDPTHWAPDDSVVVGRGIASDPPLACPCSNAYRLYILQHGGGTIDIAVIAHGKDVLKDLASFEAAIEPIIESIMLPG